MDVVQGVQAQTEASGYIGLVTLLEVWAMHYG